MNEILQQLWEEIHSNQSEFHRKTGEIRFILTTDSRYGGKVISLTSECRKIANELHDLGLEFLALGGNLSIKNEKTEQTQVPDATREDVKKLYYDRLNILDKYAKYVYKLRQSNRKYEVPWGGIKAHESEKDDRHLITKHVKQTLADLKKQRNKGKSNTPFFSSFPTQEIADKVALEVLANNYNSIQDWLKNNSNEAMEGFNYKCNFQAGYGINQKSDELICTNKARLVLIKDDKSLLGYRIKTGYPIL